MLQDLLGRPKHDGVQVPSFCGVVTFMFSLKYKFLRGKKSINVWGFLPPFPLHLSPWDYFLEVVASLYMFSEWKWCMEGHRSRKKR